MELELTYLPIVAANPNSRGNHQKPTKDGTYGLVVSSTNLLGLTPMKLGRILGFSWPGHTYPWFDMTYAPSQLYIQRIMYLLLLKLRGVDFRKVQGIDWENTGEVIWKKGVMDGSEGDQDSLGIRRGSPPTNWQDIAKMAHLPDLQEG